MNTAGIDAAFSAMMAGKPAARVIQAAPGRPRRNAEDATDAPTAKTETFEASRSKCIAVRSRDVYRRCFSESRLRDVLPDLLEEGQTFHLLTNGDLDALSIAKHILRLQRLDYFAVSTWCISLPDVAAIDAWQTEGRIGRFDMFCGEILPGSYPGEYQQLKTIAARSGGRCAVFRNHSKIMLGIGPKFAFYSAGSANVNTNPRVENHSLVISREAFEFGKAFFDGIKSFTRDFDHVAPWEPTPCK